jgi:hypothetical protein
MSIEKIPAKTLRIVAEWLEDEAQDYSGDAMQSIYDCADTLNATAAHKEEGEGNVTKT